MDGAANSDPQSRRVLVVIDWSVDPDAVAEAVSADTRNEHLAYSLLVPARLPGLDWVGDPEASRPCACDQLERAEASFRRHGLTVMLGRVGDPERLPAILDLLEESPADEVVIFDRPRRVSFCHALSLVRRLRRKTGLGVHRLTAPLAPARSDRRRPFLRRAPHCHTAPTASA